MMEIFTMNQTSDKYFSRDALNFFLISISSLFESSLVCFSLTVELIISEETTTRFEEDDAVDGITDRVEALVDSPINTFRLITNRGRLVVSSDFESVTTLRVEHFAELELLS